MPAESEGSESPPQGAARDLNAAVDNPSSPSATMSSPASPVASTTDEDHADRISNLVTSSLNQARNTLSSYQFQQPRPGQDTSMEPPKTPGNQIIPQHNAVPLVEEDTSFAYPSPVSQQTPSAQDVRGDDILRRRLNVYRNFGVRNEFLDQHLQASPQTPEHFTRRTTLHTNFSIKKVSTIQCDECKAKGKGEEIYKCNHCVKQICRSCVEILLKRERLSQKKSREQDSMAITDDEDSEPFKWNWQGLYRHEGFKQCYMAREEAKVKGDFHIDVPVSQLGLPGNTVVTVYMIHDNDHDEDNGPHNAKRSRSQVDPSSSSDDGTTSPTTNGRKKPAKKRPRHEKASVSQSPAPASTARATGNEQEQQVTEPPVNRRLFQEYLGPRQATQPDDSTRPPVRAASQDPFSATAVQPVSAPLPASSAPAQPVQPSVLSAPVPEQGLPATQSGPAPPRYGPAPPGPARPHWTGTHLVVDGRFAPQQEHQPASQPVSAPLPASSAPARSVQLAFQPAREPRRGSIETYPRTSFLDPPRAPPNMELQYVQPRGYRTRRPSTRPQQSAALGSIARQQQAAQNSNARQLQPARGPYVPRPQPRKTSNARQQQPAQVATAPQQQSAPIRVPPPTTLMLITNSDGTRRLINWEDYQREAAATAPAAAAAPNERRVPPPINTQIAQTYEQDQLSFPRGNLPQPDGRGQRSAPVLGQADRRQPQGGQESAVLPGRHESQDGQESAVPPGRRESQGNQESVVPPWRRQSQARREPTYTNPFSFPAPGEIVGFPMRMNVPGSGMTLDFSQAPPYGPVVRSALGRIIAPTQSTIVISDDDEPEDNAVRVAAQAQNGNAQRPSTTDASVQPSQNTAGNDNIPSTPPRQPIRAENNVEPQPDRPVQGSESPLPVRTRPAPPQNNASLRAHLPTYYEDDETDSEEDADDVHAPSRRSLADIQNRTAELLEANRFDQFDGTHPDRAEDEIRVMIYDNDIRRRLRFSLAAIPEARDLGLPSGPLTDQDAADGGYPPYRPGNLLFVQGDDADGTVRAYSEEVLRAASILASFRDNEEGERIVQAQPRPFAQYPDDEGEADYDDDEIDLPANEEEAADIPSSPPVVEQPDDALLAAMLVTPRRTRSGIEYTGLGRSEMGRR